MAALNFVYPTAAEMSVILPDLIARDRADRIGLQLFPPVPKKTFMVRWAQKDSAYGIMQARGLDGQPPRVQRTGTNTFVLEPGVFGEYILLTERELMTSASPQHPDLPIDVSELTMDADNLLVSRVDDRMEYNVWTLLGTGSLTLTSPGPQGPVIQTDTYSIRTYTAPIPWATAATATPIANFQTVQQFQVGHSGSFGADATAYMNQFTANLLLNNANSADFGGKRDQFGATFNNIGGMSNYFQNQNLPKIVVYDAGFLPFAVAGTPSITVQQFQKFIPDHTVIIVGKRPGNAPVGEWMQTLQAMMPGAAPSPGEYRYIKDYSRGINCALETPPKIEIHRGFNGAPALFFANAVISMTV